MIILKKTIMNSTFSFILTKVITPVLILIILSLVPVYVFSMDMIEISQNALFDSTTEINLISQLLEHLNFNITYLFSIWIFINVLNQIRNQNADKLFNSNGNVYYNIHYSLFWIASNLLGYRKVQLAGIPLHLQFKIVLRGTFPEIITDMWQGHYKNTDHKTTVSYKNMDPKSNKNKINLIIADTYPIRDQEILEEDLKLPTIRLSSQADNQRYINNDLIKKTRDSIQKIRKDGYTQINLFSTANPQNNLNIINSSFRFFGRFAEVEVYVMQKDDGEISKYSKRYLIV